MAYFQDVRSGYVLKFDLAYDVEQLRKQIGDYKEVTEEEFNRCHGIVKHKEVTDGESQGTGTKTLTLPKKQ